jgi:hypothetical protein
VAGTRIPQDESTEVAAARVIARYQQVWGRLAWVPFVLALWVPLQAVVEIAHALAGKHTTLTITVSVVVSLALTLSASAGIVALLRKNSAQRRELLRCRERCNRLEGELDALKSLTQGSN